MEQNAMSTEKKKKGRKNVGSIIINILIVIILVLAMVFVFEAFYANKNLHNNYFGYAILPVESNSMKGENKDSFNKGDLIFCKLAKGKKAENFKVGEVITFVVYNTQDDSYYLNTHRIVSVEPGGYVTKGDAAPPNAAKETVPFEDVVGVYKGKIGKVGHVGLFMNKPVGFLVIVVIPVLIILALTILFFILNLVSYSKVRSGEKAEVLLDNERERIRAELLKELQKNNEADDSAPSDSDPKNKKE